MSDVPQKNKDNASDELGVSFDDSKTSKPPTEIIETANKHLAPTEVPGSESVFNVTRVFNDEKVEMGTIVSDKKHQKVPFTQSVKSAFNEWWGKTQKSLDASFDKIEEKTKTPTPEEVPKDEDRSETISKAKKYTAQPPKEDHHVIIEKTKTLSKDAEKVRGVPYTIANAPPKSAIRDSQKPVDNTIQPPQTVTPSETQRTIKTPDMRKDMVAPVVEKMIKKNIHTDESPRKNQKIESEGKTVPKTTLPPIKPKISSSRTPSSVFVSPKVTEHSTYIQKQKSVPETVTPVQETPKTSPLEESPKTTPVSQRPETPVVPRPPTTPDITEPPLARPYDRTEPNTATFSPATTPQVHGTTSLEHDTKVPKDTASLGHSKKLSHTASLVLRSLVIVVIVIIGIALAVFAVSKFNIFGSENSIPQNEIEAIAPLSVSTFFKPDTQKPIMLPGSKNEFLSTLKGYIESSSGGVTQFYPVRESETVLQNVSTWDLFGFLNTKLSTNAIRSFDTVSMIGSVSTNTQEPFIIVRSYNFDTLFVGLLDWEQTMFDDLSPLFGSVEPQSTSFIDAVKNNASVRILYNNQGEEVLLYAFINRNTVVITSSSNALAKIIERF